ncbi:hypothetical protein D6C93_08311, partial [Aureobasidium pullulans]
HNFHFWRTTNTANQKIDQKNISQLHFSRSGVKGDSPKGVFVSFFGRLALSPILRSFTAYADRTLLQQAGLETLYNFTLVNRRNGATQKQAYLGLFSFLSSCLSCTKTPVCLSFLYGVIPTFISLYQHVPSYKYLLRLTNTCFPDSRCSMRWLVAPAYVKEVDLPMRRQPPTVEHVQAKPDTRYT